MAFQVVYELAQVPAREVDRRLRKVYNLLSRPAPLLVEAPPAQGELEPHSPGQGEPHQGGER